MQNQFLGSVFKVQGNKLIVLIEQDKDYENKNSIYYDGKNYQNFSIDNFILIKNNNMKMIYKVVSIYSEEKLNENFYKNTINQDKYIKRRFLEAIKWGEINEKNEKNEKKFINSLNYFPRLNNKVYLLMEEEVKMIYSDNIGFYEIGNIISQKNIKFKIRKSVFSSHIGIFGNTGSGKSNTTSFIWKTFVDNLKDNKKKNVKGFLIDLTGEYSKMKFGGNSKKQNIPIMLDIESFLILSNATKQTQEPFIKKFYSWYHTKNSNIDTFLRNQVFPNSKNLGTIKENLKILLAEINENGTIKNDLEKLIKFLDTVSQAPSTNDFHDSEGYKNEDQMNATWKEYWNKHNYNEFVCFQNLDLSLSIYFYLYLYYFNDTNIDFIKPAVIRFSKNIEELVKNKNISLNKDLEEFGEEMDEFENTINVLKLKDFSHDLKRLISSLFTKSLLRWAKNIKIKKPNMFMFFPIILDEAHNLLKEKGTNENYKDYVMNIFEELIREGRKFNIFLTLTSQRPSDIDGVFLSQIHNLFVHSLKNKYDLEIIKRFSSYSSESDIDSLVNFLPGQCLVSGKDFNGVYKIQVNKLKKHEKPDSDSVDMTLFLKDE